jgi:hypothetical protein
MAKMKALVSWNGVDIGGQDEMLCLTDMWRAEGAPHGKRPAEWLRQDQAKQFVEFIADSLGVGLDHITKATKGRGSATYGHWQIAMAYAKYLSHRFHAHVNTTYRKAKEQEQKRVDARSVGIEVRNEYTHELGVHGCRKPDDYRQCTNAGYLALWGQNAKGLRERHGLPAKANVRANMSWRGLAAVSFMESLTVDRIKSTDVYGVDDCAKATHACGSIVRKAVTDERASRGPQLIDP